MPRKLRSFYRFRVYFTVPRILFQMGGIQSSRRNHPTQLSTHLTALLLSLPSICSAEKTGKTTVWEVFLSGFLTSEKSSTPRSEVQSEYHHFARVWKCENIPRLKSEKKGTHTI